MSVYDVLSQENIRVVLVCGKPPRCFELIFSDVLVLGGVAVCYSAEGVYGIYDACPVVEVRDVFLGADIVGHKVYEFALKLHKQRFFLVVYKVLNITAHIIEYCLVAAVEFLYFFQSFGINGVCCINAFHNVCRSLSLFAVYNRQRSVGTTVAVVEFIKGIEDGVIVVGESGGKQSS